MEYIFAYGSLMWRPGFAYEKAHKGTLHGYHRAFNKASTYRWGTAEYPAPTLGVEDGGEMAGKVYAVADEDFDEVMAYLREREGSGFHFEQCRVELENGEAVTAELAVNDHDDSYIGDLSMEKRAEMVVAAEGVAGSGTEYVLNTAEKIGDCDISDQHVQELARIVAELQEDLDAR